MESRAARLAAVLFILAVLVTAGCSRPATPGADPPKPGVQAPDRVAQAAGEEPRNLVVLAAASLTEFIDEMAPAFESANPGARVKPTYAGTQELRVQLEQGCDCDVFISASKEQMDALVEGAQVIEPVVFAHNKLCVAADPKGARVSSLQDLAKPGVRVVVAVDTCPAGAYTRKCWDKMKAHGDFGAPFVSAVRENVVSEETNVKLVLSKVVLGEADAAFVYVSDAIGEDVRVIDLPETVQVQASYVAGIGAKASQPALARAFVQALQGENAAEGLRAAGLEPVTTKPSAP